MFNEETLNLWLKSNRLLLIKVDDWRSIQAHSLSIVRELERVETEYSNLRSEHKKLQARVEKVLIKKRRPDDGYKVHETPMHRNWCGHTQTVWNGESWEEL